MRSRLNIGAALLGAAVAATALGAAAGHGFAQAAKSDKAVKAQPKPAEIDRNGVLILVRGALLALNQANKTGNYTVLRDLGSNDFRNNTAARLGQIFAPQRDQAFDFGAVAVLEPQLTMLPRIEPTGMLHLAGFFPSAPLQVNFELLFAPENGEWKIYGISSNVVSSDPKAPVDEKAKPKAPAPNNPPPPLPGAEIKAGKSKTTNP